VKITDEERARQERIAARPPLSEILNLHDFEVCLCGADGVHTYVFYRPLRNILCQRKLGLITPPQLMTKLRTGRITLPFIGISDCKTNVWNSDRSSVLQDMVPSSNS
jgi:hypothetical protein